MEERWRKAQRVSTVAIFRPDCVTSGYDLVWDYREGECVRDAEVCHYLKKLNNIFHFGVSYIVSCARCRWASVGLCMQLPAGAECLAFSVLTYSRMLTGWGDCAAGRGC